MKLSRKAKRGITAFSKIQWNPARAMYHLSQKNLVRLDQMVKADPRMVAAANEAMEILLKNGEEHRAKLSSVPDEEKLEIPAFTEVGQEQNIPGQSEDGQTSPESGTGGSK